MAIRLRQSTQKDQQASGASFGLGLDHGDGGTRAIQGALGQVGRAAGQIAGNLERKADAADKGNADRKFGIAKEQYKEDAQKGDVLLANKEWDALTAHEAEMKKKWSDDFNLNDSYYTTEGDSSVHEERANQAAAFFRETYSDTLHSNNIKSLAGRLANEAEVTLKSSSDMLTADITGDTVSAVTGENMSAWLNKYFGDTAFAELSPAAQEVYRENGTKQMSAYADAMRFSMARHPDIDFAQKNLKFAQDQVREAKWLPEKDKNSMLNVLGAQLKAVDSGSSVHRQLNAQKQRIANSAAQGHATGDMAQSAAEFEAAWAVVPKGTDQERALISNHTIEQVQGRMTDVDVREAIQANPDTPIQEIKGLEGVYDFKDIQNMKPLEDIKEAILTNYDTAEKQFGYVAARQSLNVRANGVYAKATERFNAAVVAVSEDGNVGAYLPTLRQDAKLVKSSIGEDHPTAGPTATRSGNVMAANVDNLYNMVKENPNLLSAAIQVFMASNDGNYNGAEWAATETDTADKDMRLIKTAYQVAQHLGTDSETFNVLNETFTFDPSEFKGTPNEVIWKEYNSFRKDKGFDPVSGRFQQYSQQYGSYEGSLFWASFGESAMAYSIKKNVGKDMAWHTENASKMMNSMASIYTSDTGQGLMLYSEARKQTNAGGIATHRSELAKFMAITFSSEKGGEQFVDVSEAGDGTATASERFFTNRTKEQMTEQAYHHAGQYIKENYPDILEQYFTGMSDAAADSAEGRAALEELRETYSIDRMLSEIRLGVEYFDDEVGEMVFPMLMPSRGLGGSANGWDVVKMNNAVSIDEQGNEGDQFPHRGYVVPSSEILSQLKSKEASVEYFKYKTYRDTSQEAGARERVYESHNKALRIPIIF